MRAGRDIYGRKIALGLQGEQSSSWGFRLTRESQAHHLPSLSLMS